MRSAPAACRDPGSGLGRSSAGWGALLAAALVAALALAPTAPSLAAALGPAGPVQGTALAQPAPEPVQVVLDDVTPAVLTPQSVLVVTGTVSNTGSAPVTDAGIRLRLQRSRLDTRAEVAQWEGTPAGGSAGNRVAELVLDQPLRPGAEVPFELSVDASSLELPGDGERWGPRGIAVEVVGTVGDRREQLGLTRSFVTWMPRKEFAPTRLSVLVPVVAPPASSSDGLVEPATMAELTEAGGRLDELLRVSEGLPVDWALDPALLASAAVVAEPAEPGTPEPGTPPAGADGAGAAVPVAEWLDALRAEAGHREVLALPYADADLEALAGARQPELLSHAVTLGRATAERLLGEPVRTDVAWPAGGSAGEEDLSVLDAHGYGAAVLDERARPVADRLFYTPDGRADLDAGTTRLDGLLSDSRLSAVLAGTGGERPTAPSAPRFLAETAAVTLEQPGRPRHLLVTAPRQWQPDVAQTRSLLEQVQEAPWVQLEPLSTLIAADPPSNRRTSVPGPFPLPGSDAGGQLPPAVDIAGPLPRDHLASVARILARVRASGAVLSDPDPVVAPLERAAAALTSVAWRGDERGRDAAARSLLAQVEELQQAVRIVPGSSVNVLAERTELPVTVVNDLEQEVDVLVRLRPRSSRLQVGDAVRVRVGAHQREQVRLPIRAVANGNVEVDGVLLTPQGLQLGKAVSMTVRVRADWETRGTAVVAVAMAVLVVAGLVRTIRRGRHPDRGHGGAAPADGSTAPADPRPRRPGGEPARAGSGQPAGLAEETR